MQSVDGQGNHVPHIKTTQTSALLRVSHDFHIAHHRASQFLFKLAAALKSNIIKDQSTLQLITSTGHAEMSTVFLSLTYSSTVM